MLLYNFPKEQAQPPVPQRDIDITSLHHIVDLLARHAKIHGHVKKLKLSAILVAPLRSIVSTIKSQWLKVLKRTYHDYRLQAVCQTLEEVYKGKVRLVLNGKALGRPFFVDTDGRQKETSKHSKKYFDELLTSVNGQLTRLKCIIKDCNDVLMAKSSWNGILKDVRQAAEAAAAQFSVPNQRALTDALNTF